MKPHELKIGNIFRVADSCDPKEMENSYEVINAETSELELSSGKKVPGTTKLTVRCLADNVEHPLMVSPWVKLILV